MVSGSAFEWVSGSVFEWSVGQCLNGSVGHCLNGSVGQCCLVCRKVDDSCGGDGGNHPERSRRVQHRREAEMSESCASHNISVEYVRRLRTSRQQED